MDDLFIRVDVYIGGDLDWEFGIVIGIGKSNSISLKLSGRYTNRVMEVNYPEQYYAKGMNP